MAGAPRTPRVYAHRLKISRVMKKTTLSLGDDSVVS